MKLPHKGSIVSEEESILPPKCDSPPTNPSASQLVKYSVLPPDFRLQVHIDDTGYLKTEELGASNFAYSLGSYHRMSNFFKQLGLDMMAALQVQYKLLPHELMLLSNYSPEGDMRIFLRSTRPVDKEFLKTQAPPKELPQPDDTIELEVLPLKPLQQLQ